MLTVMLVFAAPAPAQISVDAAEQRILEACQAEAGADPVKCACYVGALKNTIPQKNYRPLMIMAAAAMSGDMELMRGLLEDSDIGPGRFNEMVLEMEQALARAEQSCGA
mgnify:CR=1 FL=1